MAQSVKHTTLDFSSGHDLMVHGFEPHVGLWTDSCGACLGFSLSFSLSAPPLLTFSLKINKQTFKKITNTSQETQSPPLIGRIRISGVDTKGQALFLPSLLLFHVTTENDSPQYLHTRPSQPPKGPFPPGESPLLVNISKASKKSVIKF